MAENRLVPGNSPLLESALGAAAHAPVFQHDRADPGVPFDRGHIEALIAREYVGLRLLITRRTGDSEVAADLLNDAICTTWEKLQAHQVQRPEQVVGFIFQVAMNLLRNHRRSIAERPDRRAAPEVLDNLLQEAPDDDRIERALAAQVKEALQSMQSHRDRQMLVRFYLNEEDKDAICRDLKLTSLQFARVLHRARGRLRKLLEARGFKGTDLLSWFVAV